MNWFVALDKDKFYHAVAQSEGEILILLKKSNNKPFVRIIELELPEATARQIVNTLNQLGFRGV